MSLIKKSDVKNHLSARYRTEIHLAEYEGQSDATGFANEADDSKVSNPAENPVITPSRSKPETAPVVTYKSAKA